MSPNRKLILECCFLQKADTNEVISAAGQFENYLRQHLEASFTDSTPGIGLARQIFAAGLLTFGHIEMVDVILDNIFDIVPSIPPNQATGYCVASGSTVLSRCLPLPASLRTSGRTVVDVTAVRQWFAENREKLLWNAEAERFEQSD